MDLRNGLSEGPTQQQRTTNAARINIFFYSEGWGMISLGGPGVFVNVIRTHFPGSRPVYRSLIYGMIA